MSRLNLNIYWTGLRACALAMTALSMAGGAFANLNNPACGTRSKGQEWAYDHCMQQMQGDTSNPVTAHGGAGNVGGGSTAKDPIDPLWPEKFPHPVKIKGTKEAQDSGADNAGQYPGQRPPKPRSAAAKTCAPAAIAARCKGSPACMQKWASICGDL